MCTTTLAPGSKVENAIYVAFGVTLALAAIRTWSPALFNEPRDLAAASFLFASIVGGTLYYVKLDRGVSWLLQKWTLFRNNEHLSRLIITKRIVYLTWYTALDEKWETPVEEGEFDVGAAINGPDIHNDVLSLRAAFYLIIGTPLVLYSIALSVDYILAYSVIVASLIALALVFDYWSLPRRIWMLAFHNGLQETRSLVKSRIQSSSLSYDGGLQLQSLSMSSDGDVLSEMDGMIRRHDWQRFSRRFHYLEEEIEHRLLKNTDILPQLFFETLLRVHQATTDLYREYGIIHSKGIEQVIRRTMDRRMVRSRVDFEKAIDKRESFEQDVCELLRAIESFELRETLHTRIENLLQYWITDYQKPITNDLAGILIDWYIDGYENLTDQLLEITRIINQQKVYELLADAFLDKPYRGSWGKVPKAVIKLMVGGKTAESIREIDSIMSSGDTGVFDVVLKNVSLANTIAVERIAKEYPNLGPSRTSLLNRLHSMAKINGKGAEVFFKETIWKILSNSHQSVVNNTLRLLGDLARQIGPKENLVHDPVDILKEYAGKRMNPRQSRYVALESLRGIRYGDVAKFLTGIIQNDSDDRIRERTKDVLNSYDV